MEFRGKYSFLSNMYYSPFTWKGVKFDTVEHFFQAMKAKTWKEALPIVNAETPALAKKLGKRVNMRTDWNNIKLDVMKEGLIQKFTQNPYLLSKLKATGDAELIEDNTWGDIYWGACRGLGQNHLGKLLMEIREKL